MSETTIRRLISDRRSSSYCGFERSASVRSNLASSGSMRNRSGIWPAIAPGELVRAKSPRWLSSPRSAAVVNQSPALLSSASAVSWIDNTAAPTSRGPDLVEGDLQGQFDGVEIEVVPVLAVARAAVAV